MTKYIFGLLVLSSASFAEARPCHIYLEPKISSYFAPSPGQVTPLPKGYGYRYTTDEYAADIKTFLVETRTEKGKGREDRVAVIFLGTGNELLGQALLTKCRLTAKELQLYSGCGISDPEYAQLAVKKVQEFIKQIECHY